jgi:NADH dehydrogenase
MVETACTAGCVTHFIHVSSASVVYPKPTPYSISKRLAEDFVRNSTLPWTIVRPTLVCGQRGGQELDMFLGYLNKFPVVPFIGSGGALKRPVHADDVAAGLIAIAGREKGSNRVYNLSGATAISIMDFAKLLLVYSNKPHKRIIRVPVWICILLAEVMKRVMKHPPLKWSVIAGITQDADLDPSSAMSDFGYAPQGVESFLAGCFPRSGNPGSGRK